MTSFLVRQRKRKDGTSTWYIVRKDKTAKGWRPTVIESDIKSEREANRLRVAAKKAWRDQKHGATSHTPSVDAVLDSYLASLADQPGHENAERYARLHIRPELGDIEAGLLTRDHVQELIDAKVRAGLGPQAVRHVSGVLRAALNHARKKTKVITGENVATEIEHPRLRKRIHETLEPDEALAVLAEIKAHERALMAWSFYGGFRPGELAHMAPEHVQLSARLIKVIGSHDRDETKTGNERWVPIADPFVPWVKSALEHAKGGKVFPAHRGGRRLSDRKGSEMLRAAMVRAAAKGCSSLVTGWTYKCRRRGCKHVESREAFVPDARCPACNMILWPIGKARAVTYYDLRHTTATLLAEAGVAPAIITAILGHSDVNFTVKHYFDFTPKKLVAAVNKLGLPKAEPRIRGVPVVSRAKGNP